VRKIEIIAGFDIEFTIFVEGDDSGGDPRLVPFLLEWNSFTWGVAYL